MRIELTQISANRPFYVDPAAIEAMTIGDDGRTAICVGGRWWNVCEAIPVIRGKLEAAAKAPPAEEPEPDWRECYPTPFRIEVTSDQDMVILLAKNGTPIGSPQKWESRTAALYAHIVKVVNECEAEKA